MMRQAFVLTLVIALGIAWSTLTPSDPTDPPWTLTDKFLHAGAFALLMLPLAAFRPRLALYLAPVAFAYGGLIEVIQPYVGRGAEWWDLWADGIGVMLGLALGALANRLMRRV